MRRGGRLFLGVVVLLIILSLTFVSASWFSDFWGKITGQPVRNVAIDDDGINTGSSAFRVSTPLCTDSDGGLNYIVKGTITGQDTNFTNYTRVDYCSGSFLTEFYCNQNTSSFGFVAYSCSSLGTNYVCSDGACQQTTGCIDNDADGWYVNCGNYGLDILDCNDNNALERPGQIWYNDFDKDRYGNGTYLVQCLRPLNYYVSSELISTSGDCNNANVNINPGKVEVCNDAIDNNCNAQIDEGCGGNQTKYFDLTVSMSGYPAFSKLGDVILLTKMVKNIGNIDGYITGGSSSTCLIGGLGCSGGAWGGGSLTLIKAGETKYYYENYTPDKPGQWLFNRSYYGKGISNETDINLFNNFVALVLTVQPASNTTCTDSDNGYNYNVKGTATYQGQTYNDYCVQNGTYKGWVYEYACNSGALGTGVYDCASSGGVCSDGVCVNNNQTFTFNAFYLIYIPYPGSSMLDIIVLGDVQSYLNSKSNPIFSYIINDTGITKQKMLDRVSVISKNKSAIVIYPGNWMSYLYAVEAGNIQTYLKSYVDSHPGFKTCNQLIYVMDLTGDNLNDAFNLCSSWYASSSSTPTCKDSDGGWYPYLRGTATISGNQELRYADRCFTSNGSSNTLYEYTCTENNTLGGGNFECPYGCLDGACLNKKLPNPCPWWKFWKKCNTVPIEAVASDRLVGGDN
jgi:hypothetical protein